MGPLGVADAPQVAEASVSGQAADAPAAAPTASVGGTDSGAEASAGSTEAAAPAASVGDVEASGSVSVAGWRDAWPGVALAITALCMCA